MPPAYATAPIRVPLLALAGLALAGYMAMAAIEPPRPSPEDAPAATFSAHRAMRLVEEMAQRPRPLGSAEHRRVREALMAELASLGLEPQIQREVVVRQRGRSLTGARVENILARLPGTTGDGAILLLAHYDTRSTTPGAGDDLAGVATVLETVRALRAGTQLENDVVVLISDAEEVGLLGAHAFADAHPWMDDVSRVLNFEARGNRGIATMFETGGASGEMARALRAAAPYPFATSLSVEIYRRMPNDTDFTVFREAGVAGLNFGFIDGQAAYHTALDTPARLDPRSLQHHGSYALALTRYFGDRPLDDRSADEGDAIYFNLFGWAMVIYPVALALPLAFLAVAGLLALAVLARQRGALDGRGLAVGLAACAATLVLVPLAVHAAWWLYARLAAGRLQTPYRLPYDTGLFSLALAAVAVAVATWIYRRAGRRANGVALAFAACAPWALALLVTAVTAPGASYLFLWPLAGVVLALVLALARDPGEAGVTEGSVLIALGLGLLPAVLLLVPLLTLLLLALTVRSAAAVAVLFALLLAFLGPLFAALARRARWLAPALLALALVLAAAVAIRGAYSAERPRVDSLLYVYDAERKEARWLSFDRRADPWTESVLAGAERAPAPPFLPVRGRITMLQSPAPVAALPFPRVEEVQALEDEGGALSLSLFVISPRYAPTLWLTARAEGGIRGLWLDGEHYPLSAGDPETPLRLRFFGLPAAGLALTFELAAGGPLTVSVADQSWGLPAIEGAPAEPRPDDIIPSTSWLTDATLVHKSFTFLDDARHDPVE